MQTVLYQRSLWLQYQGLLAKTGACRPRIPSSTPQSLEEEQTAQHHGQNAPRAGSDSSSGMLGIRLNILL